MLLTIVATILILAVVFFILSRTLLPLIQIAKMNSRLLREGLDAEAMLLKMEQTGLYVNNQPQVKLQLQVHPLRGRNFVSETRSVLTQIDLSQLRIGSMIMVKYNPANTKEVM